MWKRLQCMLREFSFQQIAVYAGNAAFFLLLSVLPLATLILALIQFLPIDVSDLISAAETFLPQTALPVFEYIFEVKNPLAVFSISAITAIWSASRGTYGIVLGLNRAYGLRETRSYVFVRMSCILDTLLLIAAILASLLLYVFGKPLFSFLLDWEHSVFLDPIFRFLLATVVLILLFCLLYRALPNHHVKFRAVLPGAVFAGIGWMIYSALYSFYVNNFSGVSKLYGSLSTVAITMLWLYVCMGILFLGGVLNRCRASL